MPSEGHHPLAPRPGLVLDLGIVRHGVGEVGPALSSEAADLELPDEGARRSNDGPPALAV